MRSMHWNHGWVGQSCLALLLAVAGAGCGGRPIAHSTLDRLVEENAALAKAHVGRGEAVEAHQMIQVGAALNPSHPDLLALRQQVQSEEPGLALSSGLGVNRLQRPSKRRSVFAGILWYVPDRLFDALDLVSFGLHVGPGAYLNVHMTRALQMGGGARTTLGLGWHTKRSLGGRGQAEAGLALLGAGAQTYNAGQVGTSGVAGGAFHQAGLHRPTDPVYQEMRDYWAPGVDLTLLLVGAEADVHPLEVVDFVAGWFLKDFLHDDLGHTRRLRLTAEDRDNVREITRVLRKHRKAVEDYQTQRRSK